MSEGNFFLKFINGELILWNYKTHRQFRISLPHVQRLSTYYEVEHADAADRNSVDASLAAMEVLPDGELPQTEWGWDVLSHIFHIGTQDLRHDYETADPHAFVAAYASYCESLNTKPQGNGHTVDDAITPAPTFALPAPGDLTMTLGDALMARRTIRSFADEPIEAHTLSTICHFAFRYVHPPDYRFSRHPYRKTSPSGGNIHCEELFLWVRNVSNIDPGVYKYLPDRHAMQRTEACLSGDALTSLLLGQYFAEKAAFGVFVIADFSKSWFKYRHSRGYRSVLMDIGHLSQTFHLCCAAANTGSWITGAFEDTNLRRLLRLDKSSKYPILFLSAGVSGGEVVPGAFL